MGDEVWLWTCTQVPWGHGTPALYLAIVELHLSENYSDIRWSRKYICVSNYLRNRLRIIWNQLFVTWQARDRCGDGMLGGGVRLARVEGIAMFDTLLEVFVELCFHNLTYSGKPCVGAQSTESLSLPHKVGDVIHLVYFCNKPVTFKTILFLPCFYFQVKGSHACKVNVIRS